MTSPNRPAATTLHDRDLVGRTIFLIGSRFYASPLQDELQAAGARVVYPVHIAGDALTEHQDAATVMQEIRAQQPRLHAVVVFHPRMNLHPGPFSDTPAITLARALKVDGIPTLILDHFRNVNAVNAVCVRDAGARIFDLRECRAGQVAPILAEMISNACRAGPARRA